MPLERTVRRYTAYLRGWCQAFGEHDTIVPPAEGISCLFGDRQIGFILSRELTRKLYHEVLGGHLSSPVLEMDAHCLRIGGFCQALPETWEQRGLPLLSQLMQGEKDVHLYLTYHLTYPSGTRIITFSQRKPLPIIYKEITPMEVRLTLS
jgi:hypothetical protein